MDVTGIIWHLHDGDETEVVFLFLVHHHRKRERLSPSDVGALYLGRLKGRRRRRRRRL